MHDVVHSGVMPKPHADEPRTDEPLFGADVIASVLEAVVEELTDENDASDVRPFEEWTQWLTDKLRFELEQ